MLFIMLLLVNFAYICMSLNQLSFSGGGSFGAIEIGILKRILENEKENHQNNNKKYDLYTGISAGSLNAGFLSYFKDIKDGVKKAEMLYSFIRNEMIFRLKPDTGISILNTAPLKNTLTTIIGKMPNSPVIHTLMGATNMYTGSLDIFSFEDNDDINKVLLMMSSSAIPIMFPPIEYNGSLYADGGTLSNELLQVEHDGQYINITYITPYQGYAYNNMSINSLSEMIKRTLNIVTSNFNNPLATLNQNCKNPIGEINMYYVPYKYTKDYDSLNFNYGKELIDIGYSYVSQKKYKLC